MLIRFRKKFLYSLIMFKVSQEIYLKESDSVNHNKFYGKYQDTVNKDDKYNFNDKQIFVSPELAEIDKIQLLHFPESQSCLINDPVDFIVKKNGARGNIDVKVNFTIELFDLKFYS